MDFCLTRRDLTNDPLGSFEAYEVAKLRSGGIAQRSSQTSRPHRRELLLGSE